MIVAGHAVMALAAVLDPRKHDVVSGLHVANALPYLFDDAGALVAEDDGGRDRQHHLHDREIRMTDAARRDLDDDLVFAGRLEFHRIDLQGLVEAPHHGGLDHASLHSIDRKSTRLNSSHIPLSRMPSSA